MTRISVVPSAKRLMLSLRDLGYEPPQAIAELIDNSIDAGASQVHIDFHFAGAASWIRIADNGRGMSSGQLDEAMRYGSDGDYGANALGGFGLGLKTASLSQCRRLTVASRSNGSVSPEIRRWDLDDIGRTDDWLLEKVPPTRCPPHALEPLTNRNGTVVLWENLDRVMLYQDPDGARAANGFRALRDAVVQHVEMVFHRFLAREAARATPLTITVDGTPLVPWDPFARQESATVALPERDLEFRLRGRTYGVTVRPFLLPSQHRFSSPEAHQRAGGPRRWNRQQGFYIYREDRLIQSGGWNRLRTQDEHTKLARIAIDLPRSADEAFGVNVAKMRVSLPESLRPALRALVAGIAARAQESYRSHRGPRSAEETTLPGRRVVGGGPALELSTDFEAEFIPRASVVDILRREMSDQPSTLRRLVDAVLAEEWSLEGAPASEAATPNEEDDAQILTA